MSESGKAPLIDGMLETSLYARDLERTAAFYRDLFQFKTLVDSPRLVAFDVPGEACFCCFRSGPRRRIASTRGAGFRVTTDRVGFTSRSRSRPQISTGGARD